jgi:hypothetical protein
MRKYILPFCLLIFLWCIIYSSYKRIHAQGDGRTTSTQSFAISGTTGTITGTLLAVGSCDHGDVTITGVTSAWGITMPQATDGTNFAELGFNVQATITGANTVRIDVCAMLLGTPPSKQFTVRAIW